jgi:SPASM domain peptide maturase of grasp-with-spasm system
LKYEGFDKIKLSEMYDSNIRISFVCLHSSISEKVEHLSKGNLQNVYHIKSRLTDATHCGNILKSYFSINMETYLESLSFNSCLNRKVGIDEKGNVKNCPSLSKIYGNVLEDSICELVLRTDFQEAWMIKKDDIADCKICEFRHMCTDCRLGDKGAFEKSKKPKKCNYDPYSATWN